MEQEALAKAIESVRVMHLGKEDFLIVKIEERLPRQVLDRLHERIKDTFKSIGCESRIVRNKNRRTM